MQNSELAEIVASLQTSVHRAYALGREEALKEVVGMLQTGSSCQKLPALLGPPETAQPYSPDAAPPPEPPGAKPGPAVPWYARGR